MKAVTFKYDAIFKKNMSFTMQISDELYDALKIQDKMQDFRVSEIMDDISSMLSFNANCGDTMRIFLKKTSQRVTWSHLKVQLGTTTMKKMVLSTIQTK